MPFVSLGLRQRTNSRPTAAAGRDFDVVTAYVAMDIFHIKEYFLSLSQGQRLLVPQVVALLQFILIIPATNATLERSLSALRLLKSYLRTTTLRELLNYPLSDVAGRSQEENRCSGHASSGD